MDQANSKTKGIFIVQSNALSILPHGVELKHYLDTLDRIPNIICLQGTFLKEKSIVYFPGYVLLRRDGNKWEWWRGICDKKRNFLYWVWLPTEDLQGRYLSEMFQRDNFLICGDFNAQRTLWDSPSRDRRGKESGNI